MVPATDEVEIGEPALGIPVAAGVLYPVFGILLPPSDNPSYQSVDHLGGHVFRAARGYLTWMCECVNRPVTDLDGENDPARIAAKGRAFVDAVLAAWRRHLVLFEDAELAPQTYKSRWGEDYNIEQMLEHAVVHPMRHRIQLERSMAAERGHRNRQ